MSIAYAKNPNSGAPPVPEVRGAPPAATISCDSCDTIEKLKKFGSRRATRHGSVEVRHPGSGLAIQVVVAGLGNNKSSSSLVHRKSGYVTYRSSHMLSCGSCSSKSDYFSAARTFAQQNMIDAPYFVYNGGGQSAFPMDVQIEVDASSTIIIVTPTINREPQAIWSQYGGKGLNEIELPPDGDGFGVSFGQCMYGGACTGISPYIQQHVPHLSLRRFAVVTVIWPDGSRAEFIQTNLTSSDRWKYVPGTATYPYSNPWDGPWDDVAPNSLPPATPSDTSNPSGSGSGGTPGGAGGSGGGTHFLLGPSRIYYTTCYSSGGCDTGVIYL